MGITYTTKHASRNTAIHWRFLYTSKNFFLKKTAHLCRARNNTYTCKCMRACKKGYMTIILLRHQARWRRHQYRNKDDRLRQRRSCGTGFHSDKSRENIHRAHHVSSHFDTSSSCTTRCIHPLLSLKRAAYVVQFDITTQVSNETIFSSRPVL